MDGISEVAIFDRLEDLIKRNGKIKVTEDEAKKIGFATTGETMQNDCIDEPCASPHPNLERVPQLTEQTRNVKRVIKGFG